MGGLVDQLRESSWTGLFPEMQSGLAWKQDGSYLEQSYLYSSNLELMEASTA